MPSIFQPDQRGDVHLHLLQRLGSYLDGLDEVMQTDPEPRGPQSGTVRLEGGIALDAVSFRYPGASTAAIDKISIEIPRGSQVSIVGRSGAGKTTIIGLLLGLHQPTEGRVLFDRRDLRQLDLTDVRKQFGVVSQTPRCSRIPFEPTSLWETQVFHSTRSPVPLPLPD